MGAPVRLRRRLGLGAEQPANIAPDGLNGVGDRGAGATDAAAGASAGGPQKKRHLSKRERAALKKGLTLEDLRAQQVGLLECPWV